MGDTDNRDELAILRYERAMELINEANELLERGSYKSANNRAFYAAEKAVKALLAIKSKDSGSHTGLLRTFNEEYIHQENAFFDKEDYRKLQKMGQIRSASDYDDFFIANKEDSVNQVNAAKELVDKTREFLVSQGINMNPS